MRLTPASAARPDLGEIEEYFVNMLRPGDTFMFAGRLLRFIRIRDTACECMEGGAGDPMVPAYAGGRMPLTTNLADRVRGMLQDPASWELFPEQVRDWLQLQRDVSRLPGRNDLLVETFPRGDRWYLVAYCFEGRNAHQTLGMLVTKRHGAGRIRAAGLRRHRLRAGRVVRQPAARRRRHCSTRTCSATTWRRGWRKARC